MTVTAAVWTPKHGPSPYDSAYIHMHRMGVGFVLIIFDEKHRLPGKCRREAALLCIAPKRFLVPTILAHTRKQERLAVLEGFSRGAFPVLVANRVLDEGVDVPHAKLARLLHDIVRLGPSKIPCHALRPGFRTPRDTPLRRLSGQVSAGAAVLSRLKDGSADAEPVEPAGQALPQRPRQWVVSPPVAFRPSRLVNSYLPSRGLAATLLTLNIEIEIYIFNETFTGSSRT